MPERRGRLARWLAALTGAGKKPAAADRGQPLLGKHAIELTESLISDCLCVPVDSTADLAAVVEHAPANASGNHARLVRVEDAAERVSAAAGRAATGIRVSVFVAGEELSRVAPRLRAIAARRIPLVVHAATAPRSHAGLGELAGTGVIVMVASSAQEAVDLAVAGRIAAERSLTPVVVVAECEETLWTVGRLELPSAELLTKLVGPVDESIECPTPGQLLLFGEHRRRVPRWFDLERPVAHGVSSSNVAAAVSRHFFFDDHVEPILYEALEQCAAATGRDLLAVRRDGIERAERLVVATGAAVRLARAVASRSRSKGDAVGSVGITVLSPFPHGAVREALSAVDNVVVLERAAGHGSESTPLVPRVRAALDPTRGRLVSAIYGRIDAAGIAAACCDLAAAGPLPHTVFISEPAAQESSYPRRTVLTQRLRRDFPSLASSVVEAERHEEPSQAQSRHLVLWVREPRFGVDRLESLVESLVTEAGEVRHAHTERIGTDGLRLSLSLGPEGVEWLDADRPANVVWVDGLRHDIGVDPFAAAADGAIAVLTATDAGSCPWAALPDAWKASIQRAGVCVVRAPSKPTDWPGMLVALSKGVIPEDLQRIDLPDSDEARPSDGSAEPPLAIRRLAGVADGYDSVARFWGEHVQPSLEGGEPTVADPCLALGVVPACASTFQDATVMRSTIPRIDPALCTGCGLCWTACPDSAIAPVALEPEALLADTLGAAPAKLMRASRQLASRWARRIVDSGPGAFPSGALEDVFAEVADKLKLDEHEQDDAATAVRTVDATLSALPFSVTRSLFVDPHTLDHTAGELLMLAVNPVSCQGCGVCANVCADDAITIQPQTEAELERLAQSWKAWERMPDTSGKTIARVSEAAGGTGPGRLASILLSRHCLFSLAGGDGAPPGSGARIAQRQVAAVVEYRAQQRQLAEVEELTSLANDLRRRIRESMSSALEVDDLGHLERALDTPGRRAGLSDVVARLEQLGENAEVDAAAVGRLAHAAREIEERIHAVTSGGSRARFGVVVTSESVAPWIADSARNPFAVPVMVDRDGSAELSLGLAEGWMSECVSWVRGVRLARLLLEAPADLPARRRQLETLRWEDLSEAERASCPPVVVVAQAPFAGMARLLASDRPVKLLLLDDRDLGASRPDVVLEALACRKAYVVSSSIAHAEHLFEGVSDAIEFGGPALIHVHAPEPGRDGFAAEETMERARVAVESRVHPLVRYDPRAEGVFGRRLDLEGNPAIDEAWVVDHAGERIDPARWAAGEHRFHEALEEMSPGGDGPGKPTVPGPNGQGHAVGATVARVFEDRAEHWATLQELAGRTAPLTDKLRHGIEQELAGVHDVEIGRLRTEFRAEIEAVRNEGTAAQAVRLRDRLMQLAGYSQPRTGEEDRS